MSTNKRNNRNKSRSWRGSYEPVQTLLNTQVEIKRDPLDIGPLSCPEYVLGSIRKCYVYSSADGLDDIIRATYYKLHTIPQSAYAYYIAVLCYARLLKLEQLNGGDLEYDEHQFVANVYNFNYEVPKSVGRYLAGFGNIVLPHYGAIQFKMHKPTMTSGGYFGPIKDNMYAYASYPCLGVYAQRMINDLKMPAIGSSSSDDEYFYEEQTQPRGPQSWDLPDDYRYEGHAITKKCLGYTEAFGLTLRGQTFVRGSKENSSLGNIFIHHSVMGLVSSYLRQIAGIELVKLPANSAGSLSQIITVKQDESQNCKCILSSPFRTHESIESFGATFKYSVDKEREQFTDINNYKKLLPVLFTKDQEVPADVNINKLYESNWDIMKIEEYRGRNILLMEY